MSCQTNFVPKQNEIFTISKVYSIYDGDTFKFVKNNQLHTVRVFGIDTPEMKQENKTLILARLFAQKARSKTVTFLSQSPLALQYYKKDKYNRLVCRVTNDFKQDLAMTLVSKGLARVSYVSNNKYDKNFYINDKSTLYYVETLLHAQENAQFLGRGFWNPKVDLRKIYDRYVITLK
ncbi:thermonuclease family protein [Mycoplasmopsis columbinasalis]|uniref:Endonuclease yncB n=1 Tax=Mycoplasmopsis columbinasalis TaxID=114880 RepID=A0A449B9P0_9BACT|nr:thermonuclease family protein [Mycoplasmopsis columbinasalis]VEU77889.1 Endonuclease yncB precursor [Mycoplasmopsis columbinasalis]